MERPIALLQWITAAALSVTLLTTSPAETPPNILFFLVDDMGWQETSVPFHTEVTALNQRYKTPNMERLAAEGAKFTQAYAASLCSPSRVSLMTGLNAARHGVTNWTLRKDTSPDPEHEELSMPDWNVNGLSPVPGVPRTIHAKPLPLYLREAGYRTIHAGKGHFGAMGTPGADPSNLGFDVNIAGHAAGGPGSYLGAHHFSAAWRDGDRIWDVPGLDKYHGEDIYLTEALTREANEAIDGAVADGVPFFLYLSHYAIHAPWERDERFAAHYDAAALEELELTYATMIEGMDQSLGDLRNNLERHGILDNTIIIFLSDNGQPAQVPRNRPLRGHKLTAYEGGVRVPLIVRWHGVLAADSTLSDPVHIEDFFPTVLSMAGIRPPEQIVGKIDGMDLVPHLRGAPFPSNRALYWHYPHVYSKPPFSAIRKGPWKLIYYHLEETYELYNLEEDLGEGNNCIEAHQATGRKLAENLGDFLASAGAQMPIRKDSGLPVPLPGNPEEP